MPTLTAVAFVGASRYRRSSLICPVEDAVVIPASTSPTGLESLLGPTLALPTSDCPVVVVVVVVVVAGGGALHAIVDWFVVVRDLSETFPAASNDSIASA